MNFDPEPYIRFHLSENTLETRAIAERVQKAQDEARRLAQILLSQVPGLQSVILFGSTARGDPSHLDFDIDLALDGGDDSLALDLVNDSAFEVDLVVLKNLPPHFSDLIQTSGIVFQ